MGEDLLAEAPPPLSTELDERGPDPLADPRLAMLGDVGAPTQVDQDPVIRRAMEILYGGDFPLLDPDADDGDWAGWASGLWERHSSGVQTRLHLVERNRLFRRGAQWVSAQGLGPWREPPKPRDAARVVHNVIAPALDQRVQLVAEQRPGFETKPATQDPADLKKAEAQQFALEYEWDQQEMPRVLQELAYWAGTDAVSFCELRWDPERGPWHEAFGVDQMGQQVPLGPDGQPAMEPHRFPLGDIKPVVRRIEQVRVSADASATVKPWYWIIRETIPAAQAVREYGPEVMKDASTTSGRFGEQLGMTQTPAMRLGYLLPQDDELYSDQETIDRITVYCEKSEYLAKGLHLIVVGQKRVYQSGLMWGVIPMARFTDGTTDPSFFPGALMDGWIECQMRMNAVLSKWVENVRLNAGPRILGKQHAIVGETLVGGTMSVIEVKGLGGIQEVARPIDGFSLAPDALKLFDLEMKTFEDLSGWNQVSRGQFSSEQSGRAILAIRESLERVFAPPIQSASNFAVDWSKITLAGMHWGFDIPRTVGVVGSGRPDLGRALVSDDFDGVIDVFVDPETLMPMPRALKQVLLKEMLQLQVMSPQEYRRRSAFKYVRQINSPDEDHEARAKRCAEALRNGQMLQVLWQDNEAIHQDVLERELILPDDTDPMIRQMAEQRWDMLAQQAVMKAQAMGGMMMPLVGGPSSGPPGPGGAPGGGPPAPGGEGVQDPSQGAAPVLQYAGSGPGGPASEFDARNPR